MKKKFISISIAVLILCSSMLTFTASAHEIGSSGGYRWYNVVNVINPSGTRVGNQAQADICMDATSLASGNMYTSFVQAVPHWNDNSNLKAKFTTVSLVPTSGVYVRGISPWPYGANIAGYCFLYSSTSGICTDSPNPLGISGGFNSGTIRFAYIVINTNFVNSSTNSTQKEYLARHEMGHVLGLGHPPTSTASIMHPHIDTTSWSTVQTHDRDDLANFYK